jgi:hypothetical protein
MKILALEHELPEATAEGFQHMPKMKREWSGR